MSPHTPTNLATNLTSYTHATALQITSWSNPYTSQTITSSHLIYNLLLLHPQSLYQLLSDKTCTRSPSLSSAVSSSLPSPTQFSSMDVNTATDTLCSTLTSCLDSICPLSCRSALPTPSNPWLSDVFREHRTKLRAAERKWRKSNDTSDLGLQ